MTNTAASSRISSITIQLAEIEHTRAALLQQLEELDATSKTLKTERNAIINNVAPISSLPTEILAAVFESGHLSQDFNDSEVEFERVVSQVTHRLRMVALETPRLWTRIRRERYQTQFQRIFEYLQRSKAVTFDLAVYIGEYNGDQGHPDPDDILPFAQLIKPHMNRCRRLVVGSRSYLLLCPLFELFSPLAALHLKIIDIDVKNKVDLPPNDDQNSRRYIFNGGAPSLTSLRLSNWGLVACLPPLHSVTTMHLRDCPTAYYSTHEELRDMLLSATSLAHLKVEDDIVRNWVPGVVITLPSLRTLSIIGATYQETADHLRGLLESVHAPTLEVISLMDLFDDDFQSLVATSPKFPSLTTLLFHNSPLNYSTLQMVMRLFPTIKHVSFPHDATSLLALLNATESAHGYACAEYWPDLYTLALPCAIRPLIPLDECITARKAMGRPIQRLLLPAEIIAEDPGASGRRGWWRDTRIEEYREGLMPSHPPWSEGKL